MFHWLLRGTVRGNMPWAIVVPVGCLLAACSMAGSGLIDVKQSLGCQSTAGAYYLPKSYLTLEIHEDADQAGVKGLYIKGGIKQEVKPDPQAPYCLDYLASAASEDTFAVAKSNHLLTKITSKADDKSAKIAENIIQTIFVGISENPNFNPLLQSAGRAGELPTLGGTLRFQASYDPFDTEEATRINDALKDFGFCVVLEGQKFPNHSSLEEYCDHPAAPSGTARGWQASVRHARFSPAPADRKQIRASRSPPAAYTQGVFYRPRLPYNYFLFLKKNRKIPGGWQLRGTATLFFENEAPVFSVGIDRAIFATRATTLEFEQGVLQDIRIEKGSELAGFVGIPLQIAQSIVALPANIIQVRIDQTNNRKGLIDAQAQLIRLERQRLADQIELDKLRGATPTTTARGLDVRDDALLGRQGTNTDRGGQLAAAPVDPGAVPTCVNQCMKPPGDQREPRGEVSCQKFCNCKIITCVLGSEAACHASCLRELN